MAAESRRALLVVGTTQVVNKQLCFNLRLLLITVPRRHLQFNVLPPCMLEKVAEAMWPSAGVLQSALTWAQVPWEWQ